MEKHAVEHSRKGWRCEICVLCGRCFEDGEDAANGAKDAACGQEASSAEQKRPFKASPFAVLKRSDDGEVDASTGATPGVSSACQDLGLGDMAEVLAKKGIKPPGQA